MVQAKSPDLHRTLKNITFYFFARLTHVCSIVTNKNYSVFPSFLAREATSFAGADFLSTSGQLGELGPGVLQLAEFLAKLDLNFLRPNQGTKVIYHHSPRAQGVAFVPGVIEVNYRMLNP